MRTIVLGLMASLLIGCVGGVGVIPTTVAVEGGEQTGVHMGGSDENYKCYGAFWALGNAAGPCGVGYGEISLPGATLVGNIFKSIGEAVTLLLGRAPVVIEHRELAPPGQ